MNEAVENEDGRGRDLRLRPKSESIAWVVEVEVVVGSDQRTDGVKGSTMRLDSSHHPCAFVLPDPARICAARASATAAIYSCYLVRRT